MFKLKPRYYLTVKLSRIKIFNAEPTVKRRLSHLEDVTVSRCFWRVPWLYIKKIWNILITWSIQESKEEATGLPRPIWAVTHCYFLSTLWVTPVSAVQCRRGVQRCECQRARSPQAHLGGWPPPTPCSLGWLLSSCSGSCCCGLFLSFLCTPGDSIAGKFAPVS